MKSIAYPEYIKNCVRVRSRKMLRLYGQDFLRLLLISSMALTSRSRSRVEV